MRGYHYHRRLWHQLKSCWAIWDVSPAVIVIVVGGCEEKKSRGQNPRHQLRGWFTLSGKVFNPYFFTTKRGEKEMCEQHCLLRFECFLHISYVCVCVCDCCELSAHSLRYHLIQQPDATNKTVSSNIPEQWTVNSLPFASLFKLLHCDPLLPTHANPFIVIGLIFFFTLLAFNLPGYSFRQS